MAPNSAKSQLHKSYKQRSGLYINFLFQFDTLMMLLLSVEFCEFCSVVALFDVVESFTNAI